LKPQLQESKRIEEFVLKQLNNREQNNENLEAEIVLLKREIEKEKKQSRFENNSKILNDILNNQRSPNDKTRFGYTQDSTCMTQRKNKRPISYANALKRSLIR
jgi:hypothetical protein